MCFTFREELQKQQAKERYDKLHMEGKTDEARADLARLALIRKQREEAAKKRDEEKKGKAMKMSCAMRKPAFCICKNKGADQLHGNRAADQRLCFRCIDMPP